MTGVIGLTANGQLLDRYLTEKPSPRIVKLIHKITHKTSAVRKTTLQNENKQFILSLIRDHYLHRLNNEFKNIEMKPYSLIQKYIYEITKHNFVPSTKTQKSIINKKININL